MKKVKIKCKICGEIELPRSFYQTCDGEGLSVPVVFAPTLLHLGKFYKDMEGYTYESNTGNSLKESFEKATIKPLHTNPDEDGEDWEEHQLEAVEVWQEII